MRMGVSVLLLSLCGSRWCLPFRAGALLVHSTGSRAQWVDSSPVEHWSFIPTGRGSSSGDDSISKRRGEKTSKHNRPPLLFARGRGEKTQNPTPPLFLATGGRKKNPPRR